MRGKPFTSCRLLHVFIFSILRFVKHYGLPANYLVLCLHVCYHLNMPVRNHSLLSARDFPNVYGNRNEIIAATTVIVLFSVIVMGAFCEPLLHTLNIRMGVNSDEYMREWRSRRTLNGRFHRFGEFEPLAKESIDFAIICIHS